MIRGIDISSHNGIVNMKKIRDTGINFVIIRVGYGIRNLDKRFFQNYNNAIKNNINVGIYLYSYARNEMEAQKEAKFVLETISNLKITYPIYIDMEDADNYKANNKVSYDTCVQICETFCNTIENAGYYSGIYANLDWFNNKIKSTKLDRFDKWIAQWSEKCTYEKDYGMWQYSDKGKIDGIKGNVDLNYSLKEYDKIIIENNLNNINNKEIIYIVQKGDSLIKIANQFNINWNDIYELNKESIGNNPNTIKIGQILKIKEFKNE